MKEFILIFFGALFIVSIPALADLRAVSTSGSGGGGISSVSEDTSPQLGGDLDTNGNDITGIGTDKDMCFSDNGTLNCSDDGIQYTSSTDSLNIDGAIVGGMPWVEYTVDRTLTADDLGKNIVFTSSGSLTATIDTIGDNGQGFVVHQGGAGAIQFSSSGVTLNSKDSLLSLNNQWTSAAIQYRSSTDVVITGELQ